jgi:hypothetical protein
MSEREAFEAWARSIGAATLTLHQDDCGYVGSWAHAAFQAWQEQERRKQATIAAKDAEIAELRKLLAAEADVANETAARCAEKDAELARFRAWDENTGTCCVCNQPVRRHERTIENREDSPTWHTWCYYRQQLATKNAQLVELRSCAHGAVYDDYCEAVRILTDYAVGGDTLAARLRAVLRRASPTPQQICSLRDGEEIERLRKVEKDYEFLIDHLQWSNINGGQGYLVRGIPGLAVAFRSIRSVVRATREAAEAEKGGETDATL